MPVPVVLREIKFYISRSGDSSRLGRSQWGESRHGDSPHPASDDANLGIPGAARYVWWKVIKSEVPRYKYADVSHGFVEKSLLTAGSSAGSEPQPVCSSISPAPGRPALVCEAADWGRGQERRAGPGRQEEIPGGRLLQFCWRPRIQSSKIPEIFVSDWWTKGAKLRKPTWSLG